MFFNAPAKLIYTSHLFFCDNEDEQSDLPFPFIRLNSYFGSKILGRKTNY